MRKIYLFGSLAVSGLLFAACSVPQPSTSVLPTTTLESVAKEETASILIVPTQQSEEVVSTETQEVVTKEAETVKLVAADYKKWMLSPDILDANIFDWQNRSEADCFDTMNGSIDGGDLLSTLIADDGTRSKLKLDVYTSDYVMGLEKKVVNFTHTKEKSDFYASSVCHLGDGVDVLTGVLWPQGKSNVYMTDAYNSEHYKDKDYDRAEGTGALVVVHNDTVSLYKDIQTYNNTATGAEVYACKGAIKGKNILWSCFQGLHSNTDDTVIDGSYIAEWTIPLDGGKVTKREYVDIE